MNCNAWWIKMNIIFALIEIFLLVSVVIAAVKEPKLSTEYWKEVGKASITSVKWCIIKVQNMINKDKVETNGGSNG